MCVVGSNCSLNVVDSPSIVDLCSAQRLVIVLEVGIGVAIDASTPTSGVVVALTTDTVVCQDGPKLRGGVPPAVLVVGVGAGIGGALVVIVAQVVPDFFSRIGKE